MRALKVFFRTNRSQPCLTSVIGRELVFSRWYGRRHIEWLDNQDTFNRVVESKNSENQENIHGSSRRCPSVYSNLYSQVVTQPCTNRSQPCDRTRTGGFNILWWQRLILYGKPKSGEPSAALGLDLAAFIGQRESLQSFCCFCDTHLLRSVIKLFKLGHLEIICLLQTFYFFLKLIK